MKIINIAIISFLIILIILILFLKSNKIDISLVLQNNKKYDITILSLSVALITIVAYNLYTHIANEYFLPSVYKTVLANNDIKPNNYVMNFETFYKTFIQQSNKTYMIFSTSINGIKYYMVMHTSNESELPYRKQNIDQNPLYSDKPFLCGIDNKYTYPVLLREDLLDRDYREFISEKFRTVNLEYATQKALLNVKKTNPELFIENFSLSSLNPFNSSDTIQESDNLQKKLVYPRFIHHFSLTQTTPFTSRNNISLLNVINSSETYSESLKEQQSNQQSCYIISGQTSDQTNDDKYTDEYILNLTKNFNPYTIHRKQEIILLNNDKIEKKQMDIINDNKFVCANKQIGNLTKYANFYASTITPSLYMKSKFENNSEELKLSGTKFIYEGRNNTNISHLDPYVNMYIYGDFKNSNNVPSNNIKCWLARLDTYNDPNNIDLDKTSKYYGSYKMYPIGIIPDDYKQCQTINNEIDSYCRGTKYINGIDYSDARKIDFQITSVQLNQI